LLERSNVRTLEGSNFSTFERLKGDMRVCTTGYFSMVAVDPSDKPAPVPRLLLEDDAARAEHAIGEEIRNRVRSCSRRLLISCSPMKSFHSASRLIELPQVYHHPRAVVSSQSPVALRHKAISVLIVGSTSMTNAVSMRR